MRSALTLAVTLLLLVPAGASAKTLVRYDQSGGFRGEAKALTVSKSRAAEVTSDHEGARSFTLSRKRYRGLKRALVAARFSGLEARYAPKEGTVADGMTESVSFRGHSVSVETGGEPPARLAKVLDRLRALTATADASAKALVRYERSGFRVPSVSVTVDEARAAKARSEGEAARRFKLSRKRFRSLKRALSAARFADLATRYEDEGIADGFTETVTYRGKTVTVRDGGDPPERLVKVLTRLRALAR